MNLDLIIKKLLQRQGKIRQIRAGLNHEDVRIWRLRDKIYNRIEKKQKGSQNE